MEHRPLKLGVLGTGMIATYHYGVIPNLKYIPDKVELVAVADPVYERARQAQREFGIPNAYASLDEMLEGGELDAVANLTPIPVHAETSMQVLQAGKHLVSRSRSLRRWRRPTRSSRRLGSVSSRSSSRRPI